MTHTYWLLIILCISVAAIAGGTARFKLHPFLALLGAAYFVALSAGMPPEKIGSVIANGFGQLMGSIGLIIVFGTLMGVTLEKSGGAIKLADMVIRLIGPRYPTLAMTLVGYFVSIPVFCDSAFVILSSLKKSLAIKTGKPAIGLTIALATGLYATHTLVPPTPGPIAAAGNLGLDQQLGQVILAGLGFALVAAFSGYILARHSGKTSKIATVIDEGTLALASSQKTPAGWKTLVPIVIPILLIALRSVAMLPGLPFGEGKLSQAVDFPGQPVNALAIGFLSSLLLFPAFNKETLTGWIGEGIAMAAPILLITGAGGAFGAVLRETNIGATLGNALAQYHLGIFLPFVVAAIFKTAQGSSTVALVATSALIAPMLTSLGLESDMGKTLAVMATGAGAMTVSHANDSYFWVVTQFSGMDVSTGFRYHTLATLIQGIATMAAVWVASLVWLG